MRFSFGPPELGCQLADTVAGHSAYVLHGHGSAIIGADVPQALARASSLHELATVALELARIDANPAPVPDADADGLPDLGSAFSAAARWPVEVARLHLEQLADVGSLDPRAHLRAIAYRLRGAQMASR